MVMDGGMLLPEEASAMILFCCPAQTYRGHKVGTAAIFEDGQDRGGAQRDRSLRQTDSGHLMKVRKYLTLSFCLLKMYVLGRLQRVLTHSSPNNLTPADFTIRHIQEAA
jgi:hypothetical protein